MLFSECFNITKDEDADDWFDPILFVDTRLFIDPFLLFDGEAGRFQGSHREIVQFFDYVFKLIATSNGNISSAPWRRAITLLELGEVHELCIGYSSDSTRGAGSGRGMAGQMARGLFAAVRQGVQKLEHFEEVQIFEEGIGADRISDATAGILRRRLAEYTEEVARRHSITTQEIRYLKAYFDPSVGRWQAKRFRLPLNPYTNEPILLVPKDYLRALPTINARDFWDFCFDTSNELLRREFGDEITRNVDKTTIVSFAKKHPELRKRYVKSKEVTGGEPYDLNDDPNGYYQPYLNASGWANAHLAYLTVQSAADLLKAVMRFIEQFKNYVENNDGWRLLWNDDGSPKKEVAFQALFSGVMIPHCQANDIDISKEANIGRGPVDFKLSQGYSKRVLLEAKLASNSKFWNGLRRQLPMYLNAEAVDQGIFLVACQKENDFERVRNIRRIASQVSRKADVVIKVVTVDCSAHPPSASQL
jgi:hypothetical protein